MGQWIETCPKCNINVKQFSAHLKNKHNNDKDYIISLFPDNYCRCGCGQTTKRKFISGHNLKELNIGNKKEITLKNCFCGCGKQTKNTYIHGHNNHVKREKILNLCKCGCGNLCNKIYVLGHQNIGKHRKHTEETKMKISIKGIGRECKTETKEKLRISHIGKKHSEEHNKKVGEANKIALKKYYEENPEAITRLSEQMKDVWKNNPEKMQNSLDTLYSFNIMRGENLIPSGALGMKHTEEWKKQRSKDMTKKWEDTEYVWKVMHRREMSVPEKEFQQFINENNLQYKFVGNFGIRIGRRFPDFIHFTNKKVIEIYGDYFHKGQNPQDKIDEYKQNGYDCLVLWASELKKMKKEEILEKINNFSGGK